MALSLKVTHKLSLSFFLIAILVGGLGYLAFIGGGWIERNTNAIDADALEAVTVSNAMARAAQATQITMQEMVGTPEPGSIGEAAQPAQETLISQLTTFDRHLMASRANPQHASQVQAIQHAFSTYTALATRFTELSQAVPADAAAMLNSEIEPFYLETFAPLLDKHIASTEASLTERATTASTSARWVGIIGIGAAALVLLIVLVLGFFLIRFIARSLRALTDAGRARCGAPGPPIRQRSPRRAPCRARRGGPLQGCEWCARRA